MKPSTHPIPVPQGTILRRIGQSGLLRKVVGSSVAAMFALGSIAPFAHADNNWDGGANTLWSNNVNWGADTAPNLAGILNFAGGANFNNNNDLAANTAINGLSFGGGTAFTLNGSAINLGAGGITSNSAGHTIAFGGVSNLTAAQAWQTVGAGTLQVNSAVNTGANLLTTTGGITINGAISGTAGLTKNGAGQLTLGGANNYTGVTTINAGGITLTNAAGLGAAGAGNGTTVANGAFLDVNGNNIAESLTLNGQVAAAQGALGSSVAGSVVSGTVNLATDSNINANAAASITLTGVVSGANLTKSDAGALTLNNAANTFGNLAITGGSVNLLGGGAVPDASNVTLSAGTTLNVNAAETIARVTGPGTVNLATLLTIGASGTGFTLDSTLNGANGITYSKAGQTIVVSGNNGYAGATNVTAGTLQLANANALGTNVGNTTVANNAILDLNGQNITENLDITGAGSGAGVLINTNAAASQVTGTVNLSGNSTVGTSNGAITLNGAVTGGASTFTKVGTGTVNFTGGALANTYTGLTTVNDGTLGLGKNASVNAIAGNLNIGDTVGAANSATVQLNAADQIINSSNVIIAADGRLNRNGNNETINNLTITSGSVTGAGTLTINDLTMTAGTIGSPVAGTTVLNGNVVVNAGTVATINDTFSLAAGNHNITVAPTAVSPNPDFNVTGQITGAGGFTKLGAGIMQVTTANNYNGQTTISNGLFVIPAGVATPLGINNAATNDTIVNNTGTILLLNNATTGPENITTNTNTGFNNLGAIATVPGGTGTVGGLVTLTANSTMQTNGNGAVINLNGGVSKVDLNLTLTHIGGGTGTFNVNAAISGGNFGPGNFNDDLIVNGVTTNLNAANLYLGPTIITSTVTGGGIGSGNGIVNANILNAMPTANGRTAVRMDGGTLGGTGTGGSVLNVGVLNQPQFIASLTGAGGANASSVTLGANLLTIGFGTGLNVNGDAAADFRGVISGNTIGVAINKDDTSTQILSGPNTYVGNTNINAGTLQVGNGNAAPGATLGFGIVTVQGGALTGGTLDINLATGNTFSNLVNTTAATATVRGINTAGNTQTISGVIAGPGSFVQNAGGTSVLTNANNYTGGTTITGASNVTVGSAGGGNAGLVGTGGVVINNGSTLQLTNVLGGTLANNISGTVGLGTVLQQNSNQIIDLSGTITTAGISVTQNSTGTLILSNAGNNYGGLTSITNTGTIQVGTAVSPGSIGAAAVVVNGGGTFSLVNLNGFVLANNISNGGLASGGTVLINSVNNNTLNGNITNAGGGLLAVTQSGFGTTILNGAANTYGGVTTINAGALQLGANGANGAIGAGNIVINGGNLILDGAALNYANVISGAGNVIKGVAGSAATTTILSGNNTYAGTTTVNVGTLQLGSATALGNTVGGTVVNAGASVDLQNFSPATEAFTISGTGVGNNGALVTNAAAAAPVVAGAVNMLANSNIGVTQAGSTLTISGVISGAASALTKVGAGTLVLTADNTYGGATNVNVGTLTIGNGATGSIAAASNVNVAAAAILNLNLANNANMPNPIANAGTVNATSANINTLSGVISGVGAFNQNGTGRTILTAANTYTGATTINGGTLQVGDGLIAGATIAPSGAVTVNGASTLAINLTNGGVFANPVNMTAAGNINTLTTAGNTNTLTGALTGAAGTFTQSGAGVVILNAAGTNYGGTTTIAAGTLQLGLGGANGGLGNGNIVNNAALVFDGAANTYNNVISGTGTVTKNQNNVTQLGGNNTYTGLTTVNAGTLQINTATALGSTNAGTIVANGATLNLNAQNVGAEAVQLGDNVGGATLSNAGGAAASLLGPVTLANNSFVNTVTAADDITLNGVVSGNFGITKNGAGTLVLNAINNYSGVTQINAGTVQVGNGSALGSIAGNTVVGNNASLDLNGQNIGLEALSLSGAGNGDLPTVGVLQNSNAAPAVVGGPVVLAAASTIGTHAGTITIDGIISGVAASTLTKVGVGTLILNGANTYQGATLINQGIVIANNNTALGAVANGTTVANFASLQLGAVTIGAEPLNITGAGPFAATGAITQSPGVTSTYGGLITLLGFSTINTNSGSTLNLLGGVDKTNQTLTINGSGTVVVGTLGGGQTGIIGNNDNAFNDDLVVNNNTTLTLNVANTYEGPTFIQNGSTLNANGVNALPTLNGRTRIEMDAGVGNLNLGNNQAAATINSVLTTSTINLSANTLTFGFGSGQNTNGNAAANFRGVISGTGSLIKDDNNNQTLSGVNTYSGTTTVNAGILTVGNDSALGATGAASGTTVANGAILELNGFNIGLESLTLSGAGNGNGALQNNSATAAFAGGPVTLAANTTIGSIAGNITLSGNITGAFALTKVGGQILTLSGTNTYTGVTTVNAGILQVQNGEAIINSGSVVLNAPGSLELLNDETIGRLSGNGNVNLNNRTLTTGDANNTTHSGVISGTGGLVKQGSGTFTLSGNNTYSGVTNVNVGTLLLNNNNALGAVGAGSNTVVASGATLELNGTTIGETLSLAGTGVGNAGALQNNNATTAVVNGPVTLTAATTIGTNGGSITLNGNVGGLFSLTKIGAQTLTLTGANTFANAPGLTFNIVAGTVQVQNGSAIGDQVSVVQNALTTFQLLSSETIGSLSGSGSVALGNNTLFTGGNNLVTTYSGNIAGAGGGIVKDGNGIFTLSGNNSYTGTTVINTGTLNVLAAGSHVNGGNYTIAAPASLTGTGAVRLVNNASFNNLGRISVGDALIAPVGSVLTLQTSGTGAITMGLNSVLAVDILSGVGQGFNGGPGNGTSDNLNLIGTLDATNGGTLVIGNPNSLVGFTGGDAWLLINNDSDANGVNEGVIVGTLGLNDAALGLTATQVGNFNQTSGIYTVIETVTGLQMANIQGQSVMSAAQGMLSDVNGRLFFLRAGYGERGYDGSLQASMDFGVEYGEGDSGKSSKSVTPVVASDSPEWQTFINANYTDVKISAIGAQQAGFESDTWTAGFGLERAIGNNFTLGFAANWLESRQHYTNNVGKLEMSGISLSAYGSYVRKSFWADLLYSFGSFDIDTARDPIGFPIAQGKTDAQTHALQFNTGWNLRFQDNTLVTGPFAGVDYMHATVDGYSETSGGLAALRYNSRNYDSLITRVGWSVSKKVNTDFAKITAQLRLAYERQNMDYNDATSVSLINQPFTSTSNQQNLGQDYMSAGAGVNFQFTPNLGLLLNYQGQFFRDSVQAHYFGLRMGYSF